MTHSNRKEKTVNKKSEDMVVIDDILYETQAEAAVLYFELLELRKKLNLAKAVVYGYYAAAVLLAGASLVHAMLTTEDMTLDAAIAAVAVAFGCGAGLTIAGRVIRTTWVAGIEQDVAELRRRSKKSERELKPLLGVVGPR